MPLKARDQHPWRNGSEIQSTLNNHDDAWIREVISRVLKKNENVKCFNCSKQGHLKRDCKQGIPRNNVFSNHNPNRMPSLLDYIEGVAKAGIGLINAGQ